MYKLHPNFFISISKDALKQDIFIFQRVTTRGAVELQKVLQLFNLPDNRMATNEWQEPPGGCGRLLQED